MLGRTPSKACTHKDVSSPSQQAVIAQRCHDNFDEANELVSYTHILRFATAEFGSPRELRQLFKSICEFAS